jgi:hypothetical protein
MKGFDVIPVKVCYDRGESKRMYAVLRHNALQWGGIELVNIAELC